MPDQHKVVDLEQRIHADMPLALSLPESTEKDGDLQTEDAGADPEQQQFKDQRTWRFWLVFLSLCLISFASALDSTIITTALPTINEAIGGQQNYVWVANSFVLASTTIQPLVGHLSNIFGRRVPMMVSVALFALGSGIAGGSTSVAMLIAGRTVQGLGSGGIFVLVDLITCDLVPLRERGKYLGLMLSTAAIGTTIGPLAGGGIAQTAWRWVFYINLPISGTAFVAMMFFLRLEHKREHTWRRTLSRIDYLGNILFGCSICAILLGLVMGGTTFPWSSWRIITPLVLGFVGWGLFHLHQASRICVEPSVPPWLFANRTSVVGFFLAFDSALLLEWTVYFLPLYFQAVLGSSPLVSGVDILPLNVFLAPFAILAGGLLSKYGLYRPIHLVGFGFAAIGSGLFSILGPNSGKAAWACFQLIMAIGLGFIMTTVLPSIQASLPESDVATATGTFAFLRSFGFVWGITIPSVIFNGRFDSLKSQISDETVRNDLSDGRAYGYASGDYIKKLPRDVRREVLSVYSNSLHTVWEAAIAFALLGCFAVLIAKDVKLRTDLDTEFGLQKKEKTGTGAEADASFLSNKMESDGAGETKTPRPATGR